MIHVSVIPVMIHISDIDECALNYCPVSSTQSCENSPSGSYTCVCKSGYTGDNCTTGKPTHHPILWRWRKKTTAQNYHIYHKNYSFVDINECAENPCQNGADCQNTQGSYRCNCAAGFTGTHCETGAPIFTSIGLLYGSRLCFYILLVQKP